MIRKIDEIFNLVYRYQLPFLFSGLKRKKHDHKIKKIYFYPNVPHKRSILYKMCKHLGIRIARSNKGEKHISFFWDDSTSFENPEIIKKISLNSCCTDISKNKVDSIFEKVFRYDFSIDPKQFEGECVVKSDENAKHDGRVITCPINSPEPNVVYQKVIDNKLNENFVRDLRAPIIGNSIPLVYYKIKTMKKRFTNDIARVEVHATKAVFTDSEITSILEFSKEMGLDYGELDILRDNQNQKIYIVDVNKTPWGPPSTISKARAKFVIKEMSRSFLKQLADY